ncbi:hypothetical protein HGRIS_010996 [Hohenbuehelia grisea]|uniref:Hydrophobin n=1 Tax=Hohenbuehelia grisea TaxID=104357 RepID=A0ABR3IZ99_9AGAR
MSFKTALVFLASVAVMVSAQAAGQCNTGTLQCCDNLQNANSANVAGLLGSIGVPVQGVTGLVGLNCNPITGIGVGGGSTCSQTPVCCQGENFDGVVTLGCTPITAGV